MKRTSWPPERVLRRLLLLAHQPENLLRCSSQEWTRMKPGVSLIFSGAMQAGNPALRAP